MPCSIVDLSGKHGGSCSKLHQVYQLFFHDCRLSIVELMSTDNRPEADPLLNLEEDQSQVTCRGPAPGMLLYTHCYSGFALMHQIHCAC